MMEFKKMCLKHWKYTVGIVLVVVCNILVITGVTLYLTPADDAVEALVKVGSQGSEVRAVQTRLTELGFFHDKIDGIFGSKTRAAVIAFQKDRGLTQDGIAGKNTLAALGISSGSASNTNGNTSLGGFSSSDIDLLARIISAESRGEPYAGQVAVGAVILNRIEHPSFPNTLAGVIYQPGAFSCLNDGGVNAAVADSAYRAARDAINGQDPSGGAIYYYNPAKATSQWIFSRPVITTIGAHRFCS